MFMPGNRLLLACGFALLVNGTFILSPVQGQIKPRRSFWKSADTMPPQKSQPDARQLDASKSTPPMIAETPDEATTSGDESAGTIKLNYYGATWDVVLRNVAEGTNSRLVGNRIPTGRFTRRDSKDYTRQEAVRIINKEIEKKGFRLIEQDELLVVMNIPSIVPRYQPPEIKSSLQRMAERDRGGVTQAAATEEVPAAAPAALPPRRDPAVRPVNHEEPQAPHPLAAETVAAPAKPAVDDPINIVVFRSRNRPVLDISREIYRAYPDHTELISAAADGLPAFRVRQAAGKSDKIPQFDVTIDAPNEEVRIEARKSCTNALVKLFRALDVPPEQVDYRLISQSPTVCWIASQVVPQLEELRQKRIAQSKPDERPEPVSRAGRKARDSWVTQADAESEPEEAMAAETDEVEAENDTPTRKSVQRVLPPNLTDVVGDLKGQVVIESFEDLGALILKGSADDVEKVMDVISQLEKLSALTAPQVHVLYLEHVDSRALSDLLTSVFERLTKFPGRATQPRENVAIISVTKPNAVLIIAPAGDLDSILELAKELDQPVDPQTEFQVFPLKTAIAAQVETLLTEFYEDREGGLDTRILIRADARTNSVIIRARPRDLDEAAALIKKIDRDSTASVSQLQIFPLKNASAAEMSTILNQAIQSVIAPPSNNSGGGGGFGGQGGGLGGTAQIPEELRNVKSTVLQFLAVDAEGERQLRSGLLADIRITPDARMNALVVSAPERSMKLISELINQLDRPAAAIAEIKVFPLINADAARVVVQLQSLFTPQGQQGGMNNQQRQALGIQVVGAEDAGSSLIPLRFSVDSRTNSIIAIGGAEALEVVEAILLRLDEGDIRERQQAVYRLKNSPAAAIAQAVTQFLTSQRDISRQDPTLISSVEQLEREVIVVAEPVSNSLLISATPRYFDEIQKLVKKLDEAPAQVTIQALLVEVTLDNTDEFGIEFGFQDSVLFDRSVVDNLVTLTETTTSPNGTQTTSQRVVSQTATPGFNFNNPALPLGNNVTTQPGKVGTQSLSNFSLGRVNGDLGFGGLVLSAGSESVNVLLRALSSSRRLQVLSRPQIRTLDNQTATILQGQVVPVVNGVNVSGVGNANPIVVQQEAGIILTVTPRISPDGQIVMDLVAEKSAYRANGVPIFTDANNGNVIESPVKDISTARAVVSVPNNQTVVIGGLITSADDRLTRKVPWLGDIPVLGYMFRYDSVTTNRKELLIFLTPRLIREDSESEMIKEVEMARMHFIECEAEEIHGPLRGVPAEFPVMDAEPAWVQPDGTLLPTPMPPGAMPMLPPGGPALPPGAVLPQGTMVPQGLPGTLPPQPQSPRTMIPPSPLTPGVNEDIRDDILFDVPAPPPESQRRSKYTDSAVQQAKHEGPSGQMPADKYKLKSGKAKAETKKSFWPSRSK